MADFGVTDTGYVLPTQQQLLALMEADERATIHPNVDVSSDSVLGQINGVVTRQLMIGYEGQQITYYSNDPDAVEGLLQTMLAKLTGTPRLAATKSTVTCACDLDGGTVLEAGVALAGVAGAPSSLWTPVEDFTAPTSGTHLVLFEATQTGPRTANHDTITVRVTQIVGWNGVTNPNDADPGTDVESDQELRVRREAELQGGGAANPEAIRAALLQIGGRVGPFVLSAWVLNNVTDTFDANGLPPHSTEAIIWDGPTAPVDNDTIAQVLWDEGSAGIRNFGTSSGIAKDKLGDEHTVYFSRVQQIPIYLSFALTPRKGYVGDLAFKAAVAAAGNGDPSESTEFEPFEIGEDVDPYDIVMNTAGLGAQITGLLMSNAPIVSTPTSITTATIPITPRQIAVFDTSRIKVNGS